MAIQTKITKVKCIGQGPIPPISRQLARIIITLSSAEATITASPNCITMTHHQLHHHLIITREQPIAPMMTSSHDIITWHHHPFSQNHHLMTSSSWHHTIIIPSSLHHRHTRLAFVPWSYGTIDRTLSLYYRSCIVVVLQSYGTPNRVTAHSIDPDRTRRSRFESRWPRRYYSHNIII